jgi:uncharacterized protein (TIGR02687 family)
MSSVTHSLSQTLARHRIVFWYDANKEFKDEYESYEEPHLNKVVLNGNEFGLKVRLAGDREGRYLVYADQQRPADSENWLLDLLLQGAEFKADKVSLYMLEAGLSQAHRAVAEEHVSFFRRVDNITRLRSALKPDDRATEVRLKMMEVLLKANDNIEDILLKVITSSSPEHLGLEDDSLAELRRHGLDKYFWEEVAKTYNYRSASPTIYEFLVVLFKDLNPFDPQKTLSQPATALMKEWMDKTSSRASFEAWSKHLEQKLNIETQLNTASQAGALKQLGESDIYEIFEKFALQKIIELFTAEAETSKVREAVSLRGQSSWKGQHDHAYDAIMHAIAFKDALSSSSIHVTSPEAAFTAYTQTWWKVDRAYRNCVCSNGAYQHVAITRPILDSVQGHYVNKFLFPLLNGWGDVVSGLQEWKLNGITPQREFASSYVAKYVDNRKKIFVIISDAMRYEVAQEFAERVRKINQCVVDVDSMLGCLPSYTQLGMASLLPGESKQIVAKDMNATVDGVSSTGTDSRSKILSAAYQGKGIAVQYEDFIQMAPKIEVREMMKNNDVIYIYHNHIDKVGDSMTTEAKTPEAVEKAFDELEKVIKAIVSANGTNILVTADHGFLFQQEDVTDDNMTDDPDHTDLIGKGRRYLIGNGIQPRRGLKIFTASQLGLEGEWSAAFPQGLSMFRQKGSGKRFVHGGLSLHEVVVPVIRINKSRTDDLDEAEVEVIATPPRITTNSVSIRLLQKQKCTEKTKPVSVRMAIYAKDGTALSPEIEHLFNSTDDEPRNRETGQIFNLNSKVARYNNQTVMLRLSKAIHGTSGVMSTLVEIPIPIQISFTNDFD